MAPKPQHVQKLALLDSVVPGFAPPWEALMRDPRLWHWSFYSVPEPARDLIEGKENLVLRLVPEKLRDNPKWSGLQQRLGLSTLALNNF